MSVTLPTAEGTPNLNDNLSDVRPIPGGVPIRCVPHEDLLLDLSEKHGFREGFCLWAEALVEVYDQTAERRTQNDLTDLAARARVQLDEFEQGRAAAYADLGHSTNDIREFSRADSPLRHTLREMIAKVGIVHTAKLLEWEPRTIVGWAIDPRVADRWHRWVVVDRLLAAGFPTSRAAHISGVDAPLLKRLHMRTIG